MTAKHEAEPSLPSKFVKVLLSVRFWFVTASATTAIIAAPEKAAEILATYFAAVAAIGTADSVAEKFSSKKAQ